MADNPSTGGGKIRPRRSAAAKKPYSRSSSQRKSLFSRVTDSVKSMLDPITPKWLSSRLKHQSHGTARNQAGADLFTDLEEEPSTSFNHQESFNRKNNNYKQSPLSRPPLQTTATEASTSSMRYYITSPDTPSPEERISSSSNMDKERLVKQHPMASKRAKLEMHSPALSDSSYIRNELKFLSTNDNESVASSAGCSSSLKVGGQRTNTSDNDPIQKPWSTSMEDSVSSSGCTPSSRQQATMSSNKRPRFNPAIFGMPALGVDKSPILHESSFYEGSVKFGGANASGRSPYFASPYKIPSVTKVKVRHVNHQGTRARSSASSSRTSKSSTDELATQGMSSTAKKILQTLEKMSSPLNDARNIPTMIRTPSSFAADRRQRRIVADSLPRPPPSIGLMTPSSARMRRKCHMPSNNSLLVKETQEKRKESDNTTAQQSELPGPSKVKMPDSKAISIRGVPAPIASMSSSAYVSKVKFPPFRNESSGGGGKIKSQKKSSSHYSTMHDQEEENEMPNFPNVPLPVSGLPSFNFGKSMVTSTPTVRLQEWKDEASSEQPEFSFASPLIKTSNSEHAQTSTNITPKFEFCCPPTKGLSHGMEPDTPKARPSSSFSVGSKPGTSTLIFAPDPKIVSAVKASKRRSSPLNTENSQSGLRPAEALKKGSVMDVLGGKAQDSKSENPLSATKLQNSKLPPLEQSKSGWACTVCMVPNDDTADSCVACTSTRQSTGKKAPLSSVFSKKKGWDCGTCMVQNDPDAEKCIACDTPKPGSAMTTGASKTFGSSSIFNTGRMTPQTKKFSFGYSPKKDTNSTTVKQTKDNNSLSQKFKKPEGSWECGKCLLRNDAASTKCDACQMTKQGHETGSTRLTGLSSALTKTPEFKFGLSTSSSSVEASTRTSGLGNLVKKSPSAWECEVCMVPNPGERRNCEACDSPKPGLKKELNTSFKFGENSSGLFKFGIPDKKTVLFEEKKESEHSQQDKRENVQSSTPVSQSENKLPATSDAAPAKPAFSFGLPTKASPISTSTASETKPYLSAPAYGYGQKSTLTGEAAQEKSVPDADTKAPSFTFGNKKEDDPTTAESSQLPTFGASTSAGFSFANKTLPSVKPASVTTEPKPRQVPSTADNPLLGRPAPASKVGSYHVGASVVAPQVGFGVSGTPTSQPPPYQTSSFGQQTDTSKHQELKSTVTQNYPFEDKSTGLFQSSSSSEPSKPAADTSGGAKPFSFGLAKQTGDVKSGVNFGFAAPTANNPARFSGFGGPTQQINQSEPKKTMTSKPDFTFTGVQNAASQSSEGIFSSSSGNVASPFSTPSSNSAFAAGSSASLTPFGNQGGAVSTGIFQSSGSLNTGFGTALKPASLSSSAAGNVFGNNANTNSMFGSTPSSDANSSMPKPMFQFGASKNETAKDKAPAFPFTVSTQQQQTAGFQFGASNQQGNSTSQPTFQFGATPGKPAFNAAVPVAPTGGFPAVPVAHTSTGFPFGGPSAAQSNGTFQFGASNSQPNLDTSGGNNVFVFGSNNSNNPVGSSSNAGFNFAGSRPPSYNFSGSQPSTPQAGFPMTDVPPNQNPFNPPSRSSTPVQQTGRRRLQARRKMKK